MKLLLFSTLIFHLLAFQKTSNSIFKRSNPDLSCHRFHLTNDSLKIDSSRFCPSPEFVDILSDLSECCCIKDDCIQPISKAGIEVVNKGMDMVIENYKMSGSCWSFANKVYELAGFPQNKRTTIYKNKKGTLIKDPSIIQPGDWIFHVNYSFNNVEHSAIFICWKDYERRIAITLSHVGQNKHASGKFGVYDLRGVYNVIRGI